RRRERNRSIRACNREAWRSRDRARRTCRRACWTIRKRHELRGAARPRSPRDRARPIRRTDGALPSRTTRSYELAEAPERVKMLIDAPIAATHRVELDAGHPHLTERVDAPYPVLRAVLRGEKSSFNRKARWIASFLAHQAAKYIHSRSTVFVRWEVREPAVGDLRDTPERWLGDRTLLPVPAAAHPDRYGPLHGQGIDPGAVDAMPSTLEVHDLLRPQRAEKGDLLLDPLAAIGEAHSQRFVLHLVPADADAEDEAPAGEHVHLRRLLCHKRGL